MISVRKRARKGGATAWEAEVRHNKNRRFKTFAKLKDAKDWAAKTERELRLRALPPEEQAPVRTAGEMIDMYLESVLEHKTDSEDYKRVQRTQLAWWKAHIGNMELSAVTASGGSAITA